MGSHSFDHHVVTTKSAVETYHELHAEALAESGYDPYNGTISTTNGVSVVPVAPVSLSEGYRLMNKRIERLNKWENAEALAVFELPASAKRKFTKKIKVTAEQIAQHKGINEAIDAVARQTVALRAGETLDDFKVAQVKDEGAYWARANIDYRTKVTEVPTEGPKQTRYFIVDNTNYNSVDPRRIWEQGHLTVTEAKRALSARLREAKNLRTDTLGSVTYSIVGETRRESGEPLTTLRSEVVSLSAEIEYTAAKLPKNPQRTGWLIYGWAAS